jgi:hypothetical protein
MAAVLCQSVGDLCTQSCKAVSKVICLPCKALNLGCESLGEFLCTPFMPFLIVTFGLNTPALVLGIKSLDNYGCSELFNWLIVNAVFAAIHMIASVYIVNRIKESAPDRTPVAVATTGVESNDSKMESGYILQNFTVPNDDDRGGSNSFQRVKHVLCYDKGMAVYILLVIFWMCWITVGISRRLFVEDANNDACSELIPYMNITISCGYVWMTMVGVAFCCSFLCMR